MNLRHKENKKNHRIQHLFEKIADCNRLIAAQNKQTVPGRFWAKKFEQQRDNVISTLRANYLQATMEKITYE